MRIITGGEPREDLLREKELLGGPPSSEPVLFTYHWDKPVMVLGYSQTGEGLGLYEAEQRGVQVLKRASGGTAVLSEASFSVSFFVPNDNDHFLSISRLYSTFLSAVRDSLTEQVRDVEISPLKEKVDSPICFLSQAGETLTVGGKKFFGGAQARNKNVLMVHGTVLLGWDPALYETVFGVNRSLLEEKICSVTVDVKRFDSDLADRFSDWKTR